MKPAKDHRKEPEGSPRRVPGERLAWLRDESFWLGVILVVGALLRAWHLDQVVHAPDFSALRQDLDVQDYHARAMISGDWTLPPGVNDPKIPATPYYRPPGYPYYLAVLYFFSNGSYFAPRVVNMIMGLLSVVLMFVLGRAVFGRGVGLVAAFFMATYWAFPYYEGEINDPVLFVFLVPCLMLTLRAWALKVNFPRAALAGLIVGAYALMRPNILLFGPVIAGWMLFMAWRRGYLRRLIPSWVGLALAAFLVIAPVTLRNYVVSGEFVPISTYFGENLLIGNSEESDGVTSWTPYLQQLEGTGNWSVWDYDNVVQGLGKELGREDMTHSEASRIFFGKAVDFIKKHKLLTLERVLKKAVLFWCPIEVTDNKVSQCEKEHYLPLKYLPGFPMVMALFLTGTVLFLIDWKSHRILDAGSPPDVRSTEMSFLFFAFILVYYASFLFFFVNGRARVPILGLCFLIGAYGLVRIEQYAFRCDYRKAAAGIVMLAVFGGLASIQYVPYEPDRARWHYGRADCLLRSGRVDEALAEANAMLALPGHSMYYMPFRLGHAFARAGRHEEAARFLKAALSPDASAQHPLYRQDLHFHIGAALASAGRKAEAMAEYTEALRLNPEDPRAHNNLALLLEEQGNTAEAISHFEEALRAAPELAIVHSNLGDLLGRLGDYDKAIGHFRQAVDIEGKNADYRYNLARLLALAGRMEEARKQYEAAGGLNPEDPRIWNNLGLLYAAREEYAQAVALYQKAVNVAPNFVLAYANWGDTLAATGDADKALERYERALEIAPQAARIHNAAGYLYAQQRDVEKARRHYEAAITVAPDFALPHTNLGNLLFDEDKLDEAIEHYRRAMALDPASVDTCFNLGVALEGLGRKDQAAAQFQKVLSLEPDHSAARAHLDRLAKIP